MQSSSQTDQLFRQALAAAQANDLSTASLLFKQVLIRQPRHEQAWLWLSGVVQTDAERRYCLEQVLMRNPEHPAAQRGLAMLPKVAPVSPFDQASTSEHPAVPSTEHVLNVLQTPSKSAELVSREQVSTPPAMLFEQSLARAGLTEEELRDHIEAELAREDHIEAVARALSERFAISWNELQPIVEEVYATRSRAIAVRRSPIVMLLGMSTLLIGIIIIVFAGSFIWMDIAEIRDFRMNRREVSNAMRAIGLGIILVISSLLSLSHIIWRMIEK
jgi:hypothetical protein